jgi:transposase
MDTEHSAVTGPVRRFEVFTGTGRRRTWSAADKARIIAESLTGEESVCAVARRHSLSPQQLFGWRRQAREAGESTAPKVPQFVAAVVETPVPAPRRKRGRLRSLRRDEGVGIIEVEIDGVTVRVGRGAEAKTVAAVLRALKGGA